MVSLEWTQTLLCDAAAAAGNGLQEPACTGCGCPDPPPVFTFPSGRGRGREGGNYVRDRAAAARDHLSNGDISVRKHEPYARLSVAVLMAVVHSVSL